MFPTLTSESEFDHPLSPSLLRLSDVNVMFQLSMVVMAVVAMETPAVVEVCVVPTIVVHSYNGIRDSMVFTVINELIEVSFN